MRTQLIKSTAGAAGVLLALALTGCGSSDDGDDGSSSKAAGNGVEKLSVDEIGDKAEAAMKALDTVHLKGDITSDGSRTVLDLTISTAGDCAGSVGLDGVSAELLVVDGEQYLKGTDEFWQKTAGAQADLVISLLDGKWAKIPSSAEEFSSFCDLDNFLAGFDEDDDEDDTSTKTVGEVEDVDGIRAVKVTSKDEDGTSFAWVAVEGEPYLLKLEAEGDEPGEITFSDFDEELDAEKPADDELVDLTSL